MAATFAGGFRSRFGDDSVIDSRGNTIIIHYGLSEMPEPGYQHRLADDRVGHFLSVVKDSNLGAPSAPLTLAGGALRTLAGITSSRPVAVPAKSDFNTSSFASTFTGAFSGR